MPDCPEGFEIGFGIPGPMSNAICFTNSSFGNGNYVAGTGMLFKTTSTASYVVTAGHNIYRHELAREAEWIGIYFGREGERYLASRDAKKWYVRDAFIESADRLAKHDFGVLKVCPLGGDRFKPIPLGLVTNPNSTSKLLIGYPNEGACSGSRQPYHAEFVVSPSGSSNYTYDGQPTYAGMSGGPLLARETIAGPILSYGLHIQANSPDGVSAVRLSADVQDQINIWAM
jgi:V8-like Glu-specific endopeptidase